jgi:hypothetical protein
MKLDEAEKELQDKIDKLTNTLYSQLGISKNMLTETATKCYQKATYEFLERRMRNERK